MIFASQFGTKPSYLGPSSRAYEATQRETTRAEGGAERREEKRADNVQKARARGFVMVP